MPAIANEMYLSALSVALLAIRPAVASVTCEKIGAIATASWTNAATQSCTWVGVVGSNFGTNKVNGGECVVLAPTTP